MKTFTVCIINIVYIYLQVLQHFMEDHVHLGLKTKPKYLRLTMMASGDDSLPDNNDIINPDLKLDNNYKLLKERPMIDQLCQKIRKVEMPQGLCSFLRREEASSNNISQVSLTSGDTSCLPLPTREVLFITFFKKRVKLTKYKILQHKTLKPFRIQFST